MFKGYIVCLILYIVKFYRVRFVHAPFNPGVILLVFVSTCVRSSFSRPLRLHFAIPLTEIFDESFQSKIFPKAWKKYKVLGIPKSVPCTLVEDLRLIALSSVVAKAHESFAVRWIYDDTVGKISDSQYGGLPQSSTINALVNLIHKWHKSMDEMQRVIRIVFLHFGKAFDLIDHNKLLENMNEMGVRSVLIRWIASYLNDLTSHSLVKKHLILLMLSEVSHRIVN